MKFSKVSHIIFDLDGLLLDSEPLYEQAFDEVILNHGGKLTQDLRLRFLGTSERKSCEICVETLKLPCTVDEFEKQMTEVFHRIASKATLLPGAERLIRHLYANNVPFCVASGSAGPGVELKTKNHQELFKLFHHIVTGGTDPEVKRPKPNPDIFWVAAKRFPGNPKPEECLVFEDSYHGVLAGNAAGMQTVMVPAPYITQEMRKEATIVLDSLLDFKPELFGLPPFTE